MKKTVKITSAAICTAVCVTLLYIASIFPTGQLGFTAATVFAAMTAAYYGGTRSCVFVYAVTAVLGFILIPEKSQYFIYLLFFGYYPILKLLLDKLPYMASISIKLAALNISLFFIKLILTELVMGISIFTHSIWLYYIIGSAVFVIFDIGVDRAWRYFLRRLPKKL